MDDNFLAIFEALNESKLKEILDRVKGVRVAVIGDLCLDVYWRADMTKSELSKETPHFPLPIVEEWMSPGAGGNVASNVASLDVAAVHAIGVIGRDWRGRMLLRELHNRGIRTKAIVYSDERITPAYCKPLRRGISTVEYEDPRIDFDNYTLLPTKVEEEVIANLEQIAKKIDVLCVADQMKFGNITPHVREKIINLSKQGLKVAVDSRERIRLFTHVILKPNEYEGIAAVNGNGDIRGLTLEQKIEAARDLSIQNDSSVCMTLGADGCIYNDKNSIPVLIPSYKVTSPIDICGAGDAFLAAFGCALATGANGVEACAFGNLAAGVTIQKIGTTGTANADEIWQLYKDNQL